MVQNIWPQPKLLLDLGPWSLLWIDAPTEIVVIKISTLG